MRSKERGKEERVTLYHMTNQLPRLTERMVLIGCNRPVATSSTVLPSLSNHTLYMGQVKYSRYMLTDLRTDNVGVQTEISGLRWEGLTMNE